jgi:hypothetical protein
MSALGQQRLSEPLKTLVRFAFQSRRRWFINNRRFVPQADLGPLMRLRPEGS